MKTQAKRPRALGSLAISVALHGVIAVALLGIVFRYPLGQIQEIPDKDVPRERVQFVRLPQRPTEGSSVRARTPKTRAAPAAPAALRAPVVTPLEVAPPVLADSSRAAGATGSGFGDSGSGMATGVMPRQPDPRIALTPRSIIAVPRSVAEDVDSIVGLAVGVYVDSMTIAAGQRKPGDWSFKTKDGKVWGWDEAGIRLGKFTIPNALLALLPLNMSSAVSPVDQRRALSIRRDIMENGERAVSEDEFKAAVKRIRERKERERRQKEKQAAQGKPVPLQP